MFCHKKSVKILPTWIFCQVNCFRYFVPEKSHGTQKRRRGGLENVFVFCFKGVIFRLHVKFFRGVFLNANYYLTKVVSFLI